MSLTYLWGNVDEHGHLENSAFDPELRETLQQADTQRVIAHFINSTESLGFSKDDAAEYDDDDDAVDTPRNEAPSFIPHAADAVDYSDFNEVVPDIANDSQISDHYYRRGLGAVKQLQSLVAGGGRKKPTDDNYDDEDDYDEEGKVKQEFGMPKKTIDTGLMASQHVGDAMFREPARPILLERIAAGATLPFTEPALTVITPEPQPPQPLDVKELYPAFEKDKILKFSELFSKKLRRPPALHAKGKRVTFPDGFEFEVESDDKRQFGRPLKFEHWEDSPKRRLLAYGFEVARDNVGEAENTSDDEEEVTKEIPLLGDAMRIPTAAEEFYSIVLDAWEDDIMWDDEAPPKHGFDTTQSKNSILPPHRNYDLENGDWVHSIIWDDRKPHMPFAKLTLNLNDTNMLFDVASLEATKPSAQEQRNNRKGRKAAIPIVKANPKNAVQPSEIEINMRLGLDRFNISNDRHYEAHAGAKMHRVRQTFGQLIVQHALPALKLQTPFFKTRLSKQELRSFHRPQLSFPPNIELHFSRVKAGKKKKKDKKKDPSEIMRSSKDLTLKDNSYFVLLEYSEEYPPIISNIGMGSLLINYYRKTNIEDTYVPQSEVGQSFVLDIGDTSPFMNFGNVEPGQTIPVLYNNLVRAPLFRHEVKSTDFLVIRNTYKGQIKYYLREIPILFTIGQTYPVQEVPGPHARKITTTVKNRLQVAAYRIIRKHPQHQLKAPKLLKQFPEYVDNQLRQRLKEFAEFHRGKGKLNAGGFWKLKPNIPLPTEEELRKMVTPEMVCLYESMLVGERHLQDFGYGTIGNEEEENDMTLEVEQQLAPWFATRNFINATQGKAMLKLYGAGDPTGRGEGFSFIRVSMKDIFLRQGESAEEKLAQIEARPKSAHRYNVAEQQQIYREEIARIWKTQYDSLMNPVEPMLDDEDMLDDNASEYDDLTRDIEMDSPRNMDTDDTVVHVKREPSSYDAKPAAPSLASLRRSERAGSEAVDDDEMSLGSRTSFNIQNHNKSLIIRRTVSGLSHSHMSCHGGSSPPKVRKNGENIIQTETVRDPAVINAYLRQRQVIEETSIDPESLEPTDDAEKNERMKKRIQDQLGKLKRNAERRKQRALAKQAALAENPVLGLMKGKKEGLVRKCGNCGQLGHMKTNKNCPKFNASAADAENPPTPARAGPPTPAPQTPIAEEPPVVDPPVKVEGTKLIIKPPAEGFRTPLPIDPDEPRTPITVKLPTSAFNIPPPPPPASKRKRSSTDADHFSDYVHGQYKSSGGRRKRPEVELADLIDSIILKLTKMPEVGCHYILRLGDGHGCRRWTCRPDSF
ncbi:hypothetical protein BC936DRAFT_138420 [Jimgerdemannia flammicorona]|uniref:Transcription initiation factor TFIID subunit 1 histone acetyltransferase domain-containing protein n=1 Tax=Jimgerdemannia flammicorona TaxID=994334 RepID=A0A433CHW1_9FUNG|nr:hypothetical protein BC936DRAFT_138420 [Jimgerdemannia flammicorona]